MKRIVFILTLLCASGIALADDAGVGSTDTTESAVKVLPSSDSPADAGHFVWKLYKAGHLVPAIIIALFFGLVMAQKRIKWLRTGYRKLYVAVAIAGLGELAERVASGTTPNFMMIMGSVGVAFSLWLKTHGEPQE